MPEGNAAPAAAGGQQQQPASSWMTTLFRMALIYMAIQYFFKGKGSANVPQTDPTGKTLPPLHNAWKPSQLFVSHCFSHSLSSIQDLRVYISENQEIIQNENQLVWFEQRIPYDWSEASTRSKEITITPSKVKK